MNYFKVKSISRIPGRDDLLVVLETIEGSLYDVRGALLDGEGQDWSLTSIALYEPNSFTSRGRGCFAVGLRGKGLLKVDSVLRETEAAQNSGNP